MLRHARVLVDVGLTLILTVSCKNVYNNSAVGDELLQYSVGDDDVKGTIKLYTIVID